MWSGPRNLSTALLRSFGNRADCTPVDEPLYAAYLRATGLDHPGRDAVIASQSTDWDTLAVEVTSGPVPTPLQYQKHMTHHLLPAMPREPLGALTHAFLVRDPERVLTSYAKVREEPTLADLGLPQQVEVFERWGGPVVDAADVLADPRATLDRAVRRSRHRLRRRDAGLARRPARHRRRLGAALVRRRRGLHRLRHRVPRQPRPAARPPRAAARAVPPLLRGPRPLPDQDALQMKQSYDPRNADLLVNVNGVLSRPDEARISPFDSVVQGGDGVWEGLRLYDGRIFRLTEHLARLRRSAQALAFETIPSDDEIVEQITRTLAANDMRDDVHVRLTLTRGVKVTSGMDPRLNQAGPTLIVLAEFKSPVYDDSGITLVTSSVRRHRADSLDPKIHHNNLLTSILAKIEANVAGADDALMLDDAGFVAETNATHVFFVTDGVLHTSTTKACPEGITREAILQICSTEGIPAVVGDHSLVQHHTADEVFVTGTMGGLTPVVAIDGRRIGDGARGPLTERLMTAYAALTAREGVAVVQD